MNASAPPALMVDWVVTAPAPAALGSLADGCSCCGWNDDSGWSFTVTVVWLVVLDGVGAGTTTTTVSVDCTIESEAVISCGAFSQIHAITKNYFDLHCLSIYK